MKKHSLFASLSVVVALMSGCAVSSSSMEVGHNIDEASIKSIHDGHTTLVDVINTYGAPTKTSRAGPNDLYIYKHCVSGGTAVRVVGLGDNSSKQRCESLTVAVNRETGMVTSHNFKDELDD